MKSPDHPPLRMPPHAYVPGKTPRHSDAVFSDFHASVSDGMTPDALRHTLAWRAGWAYLTNGFYWESHEVLEPVWLQTPPNSVERQFVQGIIQTANAALKLKMGRARAVLRLCDMAEQHLSACGGAENVMGLALSDVQDILSTLRKAANLDPQQPDEYAI